MESILVIDDNYINRELMSEILEPKGFNILRAEDGKSGILKALELKPDLILLDIIMPFMDGFEACKALKSDNRTKDIPIIFLTAKIQKEDIINGFKHGAVDYITKPFNKEELLVRVNTHLELKKSREALKKELEVTKRTEKELRDSLQKNQDYEVVLDASTDIENSRCKCDIITKVI